MNYWGYRIDTNNIKYFADELEKGNLRQGWGYDQRQKLPKLKMDAGAKRNMPIYNKVKKGDILLIPRCPKWNLVTIAEATEDFDKGYKFEINPAIGDYGHIFPAKQIKVFSRNNKYVSGNIRASLKNPSRFWCMTDYSEDIEIVKKYGGIESVDTEERYKDLMEGAFSRAFEDKRFTEEVFTSMQEGFSNEEWEFVLVSGLKEILPSPIIVERTGGTAEPKHGCDIMIRYPGILDMEYVIGIQVKDYENQVSHYPVDQVCRIDEYYKDDPNHKVIDKIVIVTKANKEDNQELEKYAAQKNVTVIYAKELKVLLAKMGKAVVGVKE